MSLYLKESALFSLALNTETNKYYYGVSPNKKVIPTDINNYYSDERLISLKFNKGVKMFGSKVSLNTTSVTYTNLPSYVSKDLLSPLVISLDTDLHKIVITNTSDSVINLLPQEYDTEEEAQAALTELGYTEPTKKIIITILVHVLINYAKDSKNPWNTTVNINKNDGSDYKISSSYDITTQTLNIKSMIDEYDNNTSDEKKAYSSVNLGNSDTAEIIGYGFDVNGENGIFTKEELSNFYAYASEVNVYIIWNVSHDRESTELSFTVHKNDGSSDTEVVNFTDYSDTEEDDVTYIDIEDKLSDSFKTRADDSEYSYSYAGLMKSVDGDIINTTEEKFKESMDLYIKWNRYEDNTSSNENTEETTEEKFKESMDLYIKWNRYEDNTSSNENTEETTENEVSNLGSGNISIIEDVLYILPNNSNASIKNHIYANGYHYLLCDNNRVYKVYLDDSGNSGVILQVFDLSEYLKDGDTVEILGINNVLIIRAGKYLLTDNETVKSNFDIDDTNLSISVDNTSVKLNTKTIVNIKQ
jgi:hypothetical protein